MKSNQSEAVAGFGIQGLGLLRECIMEQPALANHIHETDGNGLIVIAHEPRRPWWRYLVNGSEFVWNVSLELLGLKKFD